MDRNDYQRQVDEENAEKRGFNAIGDLFGKYTAPIKKGKGPTERGELLKYFSGKLSMKIPRVAFHVAHLKELKDLYFLKSSCDDAERRGVAWGAAFWTSIKPKK
jgi:hypothetical protein